MASVLAKLGTTGARVGGKAAAKKLAKTATKSAAKKLAKGAVKAGTKGAGKKVLKKVGKKAAKGVGKKAAKAVGKKRMKEMVKKTAKKNLKKIVKKGVKRSNSEEKPASVKVTPTVVSKGSKEEKKGKDIPDKTSKSQPKQTGAANKADSKRRIERVKTTNRGEGSQETASQSEDTMTSSGNVSRVKQDNRKTSKANEQRKQKPSTSKGLSEPSSKSEDTIISSSVPQEASRSTSADEVFLNKSVNKKRNVFGSKVNTNMETPTSISTNSTVTVSKSEEMSLSAPATATTSDEAVTSTTEATGFSTPPRRYSAVPSRPPQTFTGDTVVSGGRRASVMRSGAQEDQRPIKPRPSRTSVASVSIPESLKQSVHQDLLAKEAAKEVDDREFNLMLFRLAKHLMMEGSNTEHPRARSKERHRKKRRSSDWLQALSMVLDAQNAKLANTRCPNHPVQPGKPQMNPCCCCPCGAIPMKSKGEANKPGNNEVKKAPNKTLGELKPKTEEVEISTEATPSTDRATKVKADQEGFTTEINSTHTSSSGSSYTSSETSSDFSSQRFRDETDRLCKVIRVAIDTPHSRSEERPVAKGRPCLCDKRSKPPTAVRSAVHRSADDVSARHVDQLPQQSRQYPEPLSVSAAPANREAPQAPPPPPPLMPIPPVVVSATAATVAPLASGLPAPSIPIIAAPYIQPTMTLQLPCPSSTQASPSCCCSTNKDSPHVCCASITSAICYPASSEVLTPVALCTAQCEPAWVAGSTMQPLTNPEFAVIANYPDSNLLYNPDYCY